MKKKVLFSIQNLNGGGAEKNLVDVINGIDKTKYDVTLLLFYNQGVYIEDINNDIKIKRCFETKNRWLIKIINRFIKFVPDKILYKKFIKDKYDVEISFMEGPSTKLIAGSLSGAKKIAWVHTNMELNKCSNISYLSLKNQGKSYESFDKIVFVSEDSMEGFKKVFGNNYKMTVITNALDVDGIMVKGKENIQFNNNRPYIVTVGRLIKEKGFERLIIAFNKIIEQGYDIDLVIIGEGKEREKLQKLIKEYSLQDRVILKGFDRNPYKYIKNSKFFVTSSFVEGCPLAMAEALILKKTVVSTACGGCDYVLNNGEYGLIVENSEKGLFEGIKYFLENNKEIKRYENCIDFQVIDRFSLKRKLEEINNIM